MVSPSGRHDRIAYVDEAVADGFYVLAAVLVAAPARGGARAAMRALLLARQQRLHWHDEAPARRGQLATAVGDLGLSAVAVVGIPVDHRRQDRARRLCLERLLWELQGRSVTRVHAESRQPERDRADTRALAAFRRSGILPAHVSFEHARPLQEECLWLADIVAGAVLAGLRGDSRYRKSLDETLREVRLDLR